MDFKRVNNSPEFHFTESLLRSCETRKSLTKYQSKVLLERFQANPSYPEKEEKRKLSKSLNISEETITMWFYNRRSRMAKTKSLSDKGEFAFNNIQSVYIK